MLEPVRVQPAAPGPLPAGAPAGGAAAPAGRAVTPVAAWAALVGAPGTLLVAGVALLALGVPAAGAALLALAVGLVAAALVVGSPHRLLDQLATRPADAVAEARLVSLVEAMCVADGVPLPRLLVLEDAAPNALVLGGGPADAALVVTSGLLTCLDRMELEALVAHELSHVKRGDLAVAATAARALSLAAFWWPAAAQAMLRLAGSTRESLADQAAVRVTRYPPALAAALDKLAAAPSTRPSGLSPWTTRLTGPLWCSPLREARPPRPLAGVLDLGERAALLREL